MKFSVLMSLYIKEKPTFLEECFISLNKQTLQADEVILVFDGEITEELENVVVRYKDILPLKIVKLPENVGLGMALNEGLKHCSYEWVFRMDTDDICTPHRFAKQICFLNENPEVDILGGQLEEFNIKIGDKKNTRKLPTNHNDLIKFSKMRSPFNHPTVAYRKSVVLSSGSYQNDFLYEDYALWVRMILNKSKMANLPDVILHMRAGKDMFLRRGGLKYALSEIKVFYSFYSMGFISLINFILNCIVRVPIRLMPNGLRYIIYNKFLRK